MGLGGISIWQLLIILAIVVMLFGTKRLRSLGSDLGSAVKGFKNSMQDEQGNADDSGEDLDKNASEAMASAEAAEKSAASSQDK